MSTYDSTLDTIQHIRRVDDLLILVTQALLSRVGEHDASKLISPEKAIFDEFTPKLTTTTFGSEEYTGYLASMGEALRHHYEVNRHHPEHFANGVDGMTLIDLIEMLVDWKAATERHADGDLSRSFEVNQPRFNISDQLRSILENTAREFGWMA